MLATLYINLFYWGIVVAGLMAWARFVLWVSDDVEKTLRKQSMLLWRAVAVGSLAVLTLIWLLIPSFWLALPMAVMIAGGVVAWYWMVRVAELGASGHLFAGTLKQAGDLTRKMDARRAAKQVTMTYLRNDDSPMPLPQSDDPLALGLELADQIFAAAVAKRAEGIELVPTAKHYEVRMMVDGMSYPQQNLERHVAEAIIQSSKHLADLAIEERRRPQQGSF